MAIESGGLVVRILGVTGRNARGYVTAAGTGTPRGTELRKAFKVGRQLDAKVIEIDPRRGEVKLSIKALQRGQERNAYQQYRQQLKAEAKFGPSAICSRRKTPARALSFRPVQSKPSRLHVEVALHELRREVCRASRRGRARRRCAATRMSVSRHASVSAAAART